MGGPPVTSRGGMVHLILSLCRQFEEAFGKAVDGGKGGGEQILRVFEERLGQNIQQLQFKKVNLLKKEKKRKGYTLWHKFNEKSSISPRCQGVQPAHFPDGCNIGAHSMALCC